MRAWKADGKLRRPLLLGLDEICTECKTMRFCFIHARAYYTQGPLLRIFILLFLVLAGSYRAQEEIHGIAASLYIFIIYNTPGITPLRNSEEIAAPAALIKSYTSPIGCPCADYKILVLVAFFCADHTGFCWILLRKGTFLGASRVIHPSQRALHDCRHCKNAFSIRSLDRASCGARNRCYLRPLHVTLVCRRDVTLSQSYTALCLLYTTFCAVSRSLI